MAHNAFTYIYMLPREFDKHLLSVQLLVDSPLAVRLDQELPLEETGKHEGAKINYAVF